LKTCLAIVFLIIIIGGLTRLTNSGLSITEWELFKGILPPTNETTWLLYFDQYKQIPQYKLVNLNMTIDEFKIIFYWEYVHRILARLIGLFFLIPLLFFYFSGHVNKKYINICFLIFILILLQGLVGWLMVKSGLTHNITVSHYRLSIHLIIAFIIASTIFWLIKSYINQKKKNFFNFKKGNSPFLILIFLIYLQVVFGAFVSGLDAGRIYQTWPLMGDTYFPNDFDISFFKNLFDFNNHSLVQFYHRNLAYMIVIYTIFLTSYIYYKNLKNLFIPLKLLIIILLFQIILGILTLVSGLNIYIASLHQISSVLLVLIAINLYFFQAK
ncbi:COX15/CtaA family protein, partial [Pelagibacteraceae bacterium]|nr:COX15/CtaA family protein [Pelagibacteraceae bacterium]